MAKYTVVTTTAIECPVCASDRVKKIGVRSGHQRYRCNACSKNFYANGNTPGRRFPPDRMGAAIRMFYSGLSYKQIAETMAEQYDIPEPSKATIYEWVRDYTDHAIDEMKDHKATVGDDWVVDEMQVTVGGKKYWNWNVMDSETRYILASYLSQRRGAREAKTALQKALGNARHVPETIKTDRLKSYEGAIEDLFGADVKHIQSDGIRAAVNNNLSEQLQGTFRARTKTLRGLDSRETGQTYLDGWVLTYNLLREHESLGDKPPGEAAKVSSPFKSWEDVVEQAAPVRRVIPKVEVADRPPEPAGKVRRSS